MIEQLLVDFQPLCNVLIPVCAHKDNSGGGQELQFKLSANHVR